jgi:pyridoxine 5-phosphate synthase
MPLLSVNIDHVATVREARKTNEPDPVWAAALAEMGGADGITVHLREDRRHIQDRDLRLLLETVALPLNLEFACDEEVVCIAVEAKPHLATLVPEKREEVTTGGGLDVVGSRLKVAQVIRRLQDVGSEVSLFLDPDPAQIEVGIESGADAIELHTGPYAHASVHDNAGCAGHTGAQLETLRVAGKQICSAGLNLHAGHGLTYRNVRPIAAIEGMSELYIGHSIIARAIMVGLDRAVRDMKELVSELQVGW